MFLRSRINSLKLILVMMCLEYNTRNEDAFLDYKSCVAITFLFRYVESSLYSVWRLLEGTLVFSERRGGRKRPSFLK